MTNTRRRNRANATAANGAGGGTRRHFNVGELLNSGSNDFDVVLVVVSLGRLAFGECRTLNEVHNDIIPTPPAREAKVNLGNADDARRVGVHDPCHMSLCTAFTSHVGIIAVFEPESRLACDRMQTPFRLKPALTHALKMSSWVGKTAGMFPKCQTWSSAMTGVHISGGTGVKRHGDDLTLKSRVCRTRK